MPAKRRLGLIVLLGAAIAAFWIRSSTPRFQQEGGEFKGEIPGIGAVQAMLIRRDGAPMLEIEKIPAERFGEWWLNGTNLGNQVEFKTFLTQPNEPAFFARTDPAGAHVTGIFIAANGTRSSFLLTSEGGTMAYHRTNKLMFRGNGRSFDWHARIPALDGDFGTAVEDWLVNDMRQREKEDDQAFAPSAKETWEALRNGGPVWLWDSDAQWRLKYRSTNQMSLLCRHYRYRGGAHGNTDVDAVSFRWQNGALQRIRLRDFFRPDGDWREILVHNVMADLKRQEASFLEERSVRDRIRFETFTFDEHGLTFYFAPYEVGSYAEGMYTSHLAWSQLNALLTQPSHPQ